MNFPAFRLPPIERPGNPLLRLAYWASARSFGKVLAPLRVVYSRKPRLLAIALQMQRTLEHGLTLEPELRLLVQVQAARVNGCAFCEDLALATAVRARVGTDRFDALVEFRSSDLFTHREKSALALTEQAVRDRRVDDGTFAAARSHFDDKQLVELVWVAAAETYFNIQAHTLGLGSDELFAAQT